MPRKRIFIALPISEELGRLVFEWEKQFANLPVRWLKGKNLHVTLVPPWYEEDVDSVKKRLEILSGKGGAQAVFEKISFGPDPRRPRLIWVEGKAPQKLEDLKKELEGIFGAKSDLKKWKMHLTLARFREEDFSGFPVKTLDENVSWSEDFGSIVLFESKLSPEGAEYEILHRVKL